MPVLNQADKLYLGRFQVVRAYKAGSLVFGLPPEEPEPDPTGITDEANMFERWFADDHPDGVVTDWHGQKGMIATALSEARQANTAVVDGVKTIHCTSTLLRTPAFSGLGEISVYMTLRFGAVDPWPRTLIGHDNGGSQKGWSLNGNYGEAAFSTFTGATGSASSMGQFSANTWYVMGGVRTDANVQGYLNDVVGPLSTNGGYNSVNTGFSIGGRGNDTNRPGDMHIREIRIYTVPHDAATRQAVMNEMKIT